MRGEIPPLLRDGGGLLALRGSSVRPRIGGLFAALFDVVALAELMPMCGEDWGCCWGCGCCCEYWCWGCCAIFVKLIDMFPFGCITAPEVVDMEDEFDGAAALNGVLLAGGGVLLVGGGVLHIGGGPPLLNGGGGLFDEPPRGESAAAFILMLIESVLTLADCGRGGRWGGAMRLPCEE